MRRDGAVDGERVVRVRGARLRNGPGRAQCVVAPRWGRSQSRAQVTYGPLSDGRPQAPRWTRRESNPLNLLAREARRPRHKPGCPVTWGRRRATARIAARRSRYATSARARRPRPRAPRRRARPRPPRARTRARGSTQRRARRGCPRARVRRGSQPRLHDADAAVEARVLRAADPSEPVVRTLPRSRCAQNRGDGPRPRARGSVCGAGHDARLHGHRTLTRTDRSTRHSAHAVSHAT